MEEEISFDSCEESICFWKKFVQKSICPFQQIQQFCQVVFNSMLFFISDKFFCNIIYLTH
eukprot:UN20068